MAGGQLSLVTLLVEVFKIVWTIINGFSVQAFCGSLYPLCPFEKPGVEIDQAASRSSTVIFGQELDMSLALSQSQARIAREGF